MKRRGVLLFISVLVILCGLMILIKRRKGPDLQTILTRLERLSPSSEADDLEREGFLNLSDIQPGPVKEVDEFFKGNKQVLTFFLETEDGPVFQLFTINHSNLLFVNTYFVQSKRLQSPNRAFAYQVSSKIKENGTVEVWLHGVAPPEEGIPGWTDCLLYRYKRQGDG